MYSSYADQIQAGPWALFLKLILTKFKLSTTTQISIDQMILDGVS